MSDEPLRKGRLRVSPSAERHRYRLLLINHYRQSKTYRWAIERDLRPLLERVDSFHSIDNTVFVRLCLAYDLLRTFSVPTVGSDHYDQWMQEQLRAVCYLGENDLPTPYHDILARDLLRIWLLDEHGNERQPGGEKVIELLSLAEMRRYLYKLYRFTFRLGLRWGGQPATWAAAFIHADVTTKPGEPGNDPRPREFGTKREWRLTVWAFADEGLALTQEFSHNPETTTPSPSSAARTPDPLRPFAYLDELEEAAVNHLRESFASLRTELEATHKPRNSATIANRDEYVEEIYVHLFNDDNRRIPLDHNTKAKLRPFLTEQLELDFPEE